MLSNLLLLESFSFFHSFCLSFYFWQFTLPFLKTIFFKAIFLSTRNIHNRSHSLSLSLTHTHALCHSLTRSLSLSLSFHDAYPCKRHSPYSLRENNFAWTRCCFSPYLSLVDISWFSRSFISNTFSPPSSKCFEVNLKLYMKKRRTTYSIFRFCVTIILSSDYLVKINGRNQSMWCSTK